MMKDQVKQDSLRSELLEALGGIVVVVFVVVSVAVVLFFPVHARASGYARWGFWSLR